VTHTPLASLDNTSGASKIRNRPRFGAPRRSKFSSCLTLIAGAHFCYKLQATDSIGLPNVIAMLSYHFNWLVRCLWHETHIMIVHLDFLPYDSTSLHSANIYEIAESPVNYPDLKGPMEATTRRPSGALPLIGAKSPSVTRIEALNANTSFLNHCCIFFRIFLVAYAFGLDGTLRGRTSPLPRGASKSTLRWPQLVRYTKIEAGTTTEIVLDVLRSVIAVAAQVSICRLTCDRLSPNANSNQPTVAKIGKKTLSRWRTLH
jgi:hypothetical protein